MRAETATAPDAGATSKQREPRDRRRRVVVVALAGVVLVAGLAWAWHWRTHPDIVPGNGAGMRMTLDDQRRSVFVTVTDPSPGEGETVRIDSATPRMLQNTAEATVEFFVCRLDLRGANHSALGAVGPRHFAGVCPDPVPVVEGTELAIGAEPPQQLLMRVVVESPGRLRIDGVDLTYTHGWQRGTQTVGPRLVIRSRMRP